MMERSEVFHCRGCQQLKEIDDGAVQSVAEQKR